jgi:hypothetical protein
MLKRILPRRRAGIGRHPECFDTSAVAPNRSSKLRRLLEELITVLARFGPS